jgi:hypothetical protein
MLFEKYKQTIIRLVLVAVMSFTLSLMLFMPAQAAEYNCGAYGRAKYDSGQVCAATTDPESEEGGLANTGQALSIAIPALMIVAGTALLFKTRKHAKHTSLE